MKHEDDVAADQAIFRARVYGLEGSWSDALQVSLRAYLQQERGSLLEIVSDGAVPVVVFAMPSTTSTVAAQAAMTVLPWLPGALAAWLIIHNAPTGPPPGAQAASPEIHVPVDAKPTGCGQDPSVSVASLEALGRFVSALQREPPRLSSDRRGHATPHIVCRPSAPGSSR